MTIAFPCENCGHRFEVDAGLAGKKCKCKKCGHVFLIPVPRPTIPAPEPASTSRKTGRSRSSGPGRSRPGTRPSPRRRPLRDDDDPLPPASRPPARGQEVDPRHRGRGVPPPAGRSPTRTVRSKRSATGRPSTRPRGGGAQGRGALTLASALVCLLSLQTRSDPGERLLFRHGFHPLLPWGGSEWPSCRSWSRLRSDEPVRADLSPLLPDHAWDDMKRVVPDVPRRVLLACPGFFFRSWVSPVVDIVRDAAEAARLREIDAAGPNDPRRARREAEYAPGSGPSSTGQRQFGESPGSETTARRNPPPETFVAPAPIGPAVRGKPNRSRRPRTRRRSGESSRSSPRRPKALTCPKRHAKIRPGGRGPGSHLCPSRRPTRDFVAQTLIGLKCVVPAASKRDAGGTGRSRR